MEIIRLDEKTVEIRQIDRFSVELLRQIPSETDPGDDFDSNERLYSPPIDEPGDPLNEEWEDYVTPELRQLFESSNETVAGDLKTIARANGEEEEPEYLLRIPVGHLERWLNTLNQARLVLAARNKFTEEELESEQEPIINTQRDLNLLQIHFYAFLQEIFLRELQ